MPENKKTSKQKILNKKPRRKKLKFVRNNLNKYFSLFHLCLFIQCCTCLNKITNSERMKLNQNYQFEKHL